MGTQKQTYILYGALEDTEYCIPGASFYSQKKYVNEIKLILFIKKIKSNCNIRMHK